MILFMSLIVHLHLLIHDTIFRFQPLLSDSTTHPSLKIPNQFSHLVRQFSMTQKFGHQKNLNLLSQ